jgi:hypothetical protein
LTNLLALDLSFCPNLRVKTKTGRLELPDSLVTFHFAGNNLDLLPGGVPLTLQKVSLTVDDYRYMGAGLRAARPPYATDLGPATLWKRRWFQVIRDRNRRYRVNCIVLRALVCLYMTIVRRRYWSPDAPGGAALIDRGFVLH